MKTVVKQVVRSEQHVDRLIECTWQDTSFQHFVAPLGLWFKETLDHRATIDALTKALAHYPIFSARFRQRDGRLQIECRDQGVPVTVTNRRETFDHWRDNMNAPGSKRQHVDMLNARHAITRGAPLASIRISHFRGGGSCLAFAYHHSLGDLGTIKSFFQAWSNASVGKPIEPPIIAEDRSRFIDEHLSDNGCTIPSVRRLTGLDMAQMASMLSWQMLNFRTINCHFSDRELETMRATFQQQTDVRLSTNDALCAHVASLVDNLYPKAGIEQLCIVVDWRSRVGLPASFLGNASEDLLIPHKRNRAPFLTAVETRRHLDDFAAQHMKYMCNDRFMARQEPSKLAARVWHNGLDPRQRVLYLNSWKDPAFYDLDFAGVRPYLFGFPWHTLLPWMGIVSGGFDKRGALLTISLPRGALKRLRVEPALHRYRTGTETPSGRAANAFQVL